MDYCFSGTGKSNVACLESLSHVLTWKRVLTGGLSESPRPVSWPQKSFISQQKKVELLQRYVYVLQFSFSTPLMSNPIRWEGPVKTAWEQEQKWQEGRDMQELLGLPVWPNSLILYSEIVPFARHSMRLPPPKSTQSRHTYSNIYRPCQCNLYPAITENQDYVYVTHVHMS